jgi:hypothetical protein
MSVCQTAIRRRRQALNGQAQLSPRQRPHYKRLDAGTSKKRLERAIQRERDMAQRKGRKK